MKINKIIRREGNKKIIVFLQNKKYVLKLSSFIDYTIEHEYLISSILYEHFGFMPHFVKPISLDKYKVSIYYREIENPFLYEDEKYICINGYKETYVSSHTLVNHIKSNYVYSYIIQVFLCIYILQNSLQFTHYDLRLQNILLKPVNNCIHLYVINNHHYIIPIYDNIICLTDFETSICKAGDRNFFTLLYTEFNILPFFHSYYDIYTLLVDLYKYLPRSSELFHKIETMYTFINTIGYNINELEFKNVFEYIQYNSVNGIFTKNWFPYSMSLILSLSANEYNKISDVSIYISKIEHQWNIIQSYIDNSIIYQLYIFKSIIEYIKQYKHIYNNDQLTFYTNFNNYIYNILNVTSIPSLNLKDLVENIFYTADSLYYYVHNIMKLQMEDICTIHNIIDNYLQNSICKYMIDMLYDTSNIYINTTTPIHLFDIENKHHSVHYLTECEFEQYNQVENKPEWLYELLL